MNIYQAKKLNDEITKIRKLLEESIDRVVVALSGVN